MELNPPSPKHSLTENPDPLMLAHMQTRKPNQRNKRSRTDGKTRLVFQFISCYKIVKTERTY